MFIVEGLHVSSDFYSLTLQDSEVFAGGSVVSGLELSHFLLSQPMLFLLLFIVTYLCKNLGTSLSQCSVFSICSSPGILTMTQCGQVCFWPLLLGHRHYAGPPPVNRRVSSQAILSQPRGLMLNVTVSYTAWPRHALSGHVMRCVALSCSVGMFAQRVPHKQVPPAPHSLNPSLPVDCHNPLSFRLPINKLSRGFVVYCGLF